MRGVHVLRGVSICIARKDCFGRESWTSLESCSTVCDDCRTACIHKHVILRMPNPSANTQSDCVGRWFATSVFCFVGQHWNLVYHSSCDRNVAIHDVYCHCSSVKSPEVYNIIIASWFGEKRAIELLCASVQIIYIYDNPYTIVWWTCYYFLSNAVEMNVRASVWIYCDF